MAPNPDTYRPQNALRGWDSFTNILGRHLPYQLTRGGQARKALYALMYPRKR